MRDAIFDSVQRVLDRHYGDLAALTVTRRTLRGGLEAGGTEHVVARFVDAGGRRQVVGFVVKPLVGRAVREAAIYQHVLAKHDGVVVPKLLGSERLDDERIVLLLEPVRSVNTWPWGDVSMSARVLMHVARVHRMPRSVLRVVPHWDYEGELRGSALQTLEMLEMCRREPWLRPLARALPWARRLVHALPRIRRELLEATPGQCVLHGDLHSGNVIMRRRRREVESVLIDWGRARVGSPLEDVSSWLQSLGCWESEARRRHDTLLVRYLRASGLPERLTGELRESYWLAGASNVLAGSLSYHLQRVRGAEREAERAGAFYAAHDAVRVLRRADSVWS